MAESKNTVNDYVPFSMLQIMQLFLEFNFIEKKKK